MTMKKENYIDKESIKKSITELFINPGKILFHKTYSLLLNKGNFIENIAKELTKIPDNDIMLENDKINYNLIISSKELISKLLTKSEIVNDYLGITIDFSFFYDKPFYFITIADEKKIFLNISKKLHFKNFENNKLLTTSTTNTINNKNKIPFDKNIKKSSRNKIKNSSTKSINSLKMADNKSELNILKLEKEYIKNKNNNDEILSKIDKNRKKINRDTFNIIIKWILSIIIGCILVIYNL